MYISYVHWQQPHPTIVCVLFTPGKRQGAESGCHGAEKCSQSLSKAVDGASRLRQRRIADHDKQNGETRHSKK